MTSKAFLAFCVLCFVWGTTWWATKIAIATEPPLLIAGTRFIAAGIIMTAVGSRDRALRQWTWPDTGRLTVVSLLMIVLCYGPLFWGMQFIESGLSAVIEMSLTPVALLFCAVALGEEKLTVRKVAALVLGIIGVAIMFSPDLGRMLAAHGQGRMRVIGGVAVALSAFTYALGSVLSRPLLRLYSATFISGVSLLAGGLILLAASLAVEPGAREALRFRWTAEAWTGWLYLTVFGSLVAFALYMKLLRDVGASRSGNFAFVSPAIAVLTGAIALHERVPAVTWVGMAVMLGAAYISLHAKEA